MKAPDHPYPQATLQQMGTQPTNPQPVGDPITVQFNPTTLRLAMQNSVDMKKAFGHRPATQYDGTSSSTLTFDLIFDCTDEGTSQTPVDVRTRVAPIEKFLLPAPGQRKSIPPRVQFTYGTFQLIGVMTALNSDYDLFSSNGVPLRARLNVSIKEQLPEYEQGAVGSGANTGAGAQDQQGLVPAGGTAPVAPSQTGTALAGESAPDFASRMGLDPAAWKGLDLGGLDPLSLTAGAAIDFSASLTVDLGVSVGLTADLSVGGSAFGSGGAGLTPAAVTAAGGLQQALDADARQVADRAAASARAGFGQAAPTRVPVAVGAGSPIAAAPPRVADRRGLTFGFGVPLRASLEPPDAYGRLAGAGAPVAAISAISGDVPMTDDPCVPGWLALRRSGATSSSGAGGCGCGGACGGSCGGGGGCGGGCGSGRGAGKSGTVPSAGVRATEAIRRTPALAGRGGCGGCNGCWGCG